MIDKLDRLVEDMMCLNSKLILLIGPPRSGKSALLARLSERRREHVLNVGAVLGRQLITVPNTRRHLQASEIWTKIADETDGRRLLLLDNIELLFDRNLQLCPLSLLKRHAHIRRVIAVWPGELRASRISYARTGHPEYRDYGIDGLVPFKIH